VTTSSSRARRSGGAPPVVVGWREWLALPDWGVDHVKAKIDTGARTSALHTFGLEPFERDGEEWVRFHVHPWQRSADDDVPVEARLIGRRSVKSSSGVSNMRPVVHTKVRLAGRSLRIEVTLTRRDTMGFRMLIGRQALRRNFLVDPAASYLGGRPPIEMRRRNRRRS
jgi:hypothetical protein